MRQVSPSSVIQRPVLQNQAVFRNLETFSRARDMAYTEWWHKHNRASRFRYGDRSSAGACVCILYLESGECKSSPISHKHAMVLNQQHLDSI
jgi:hypothetical protein